MTARVVHADCLDAMREMPDASIDAIVTDPPYGLAFMGKNWDHGVPGVPFWAEAFRVAKPGAHLVAFGGTRTYHRLACAIEDAGWEVRDCLSWLYGSGFPKSLDVSKAIDKKKDDWADIAAVVRFLEDARQISGVSRKQVENHFGTVNIGQAFFTLTPGSKPRVPMWNQWEKLKTLLGFSDAMDAEVWRLNGRKGKPGDAWAEREVVGSQRGTTLAVAPGQGMDRATTDLPITAPATDAAKQWQGWGTALKPGWEPAILARKPLVGTVASNVLAHGTGAINVDGCRIEGNRWPANVAFDEAAAHALDEQTGGASRFFYTAKASRSERNAGCENIEARPQDPTRELDAAGGNNPRNRGAAPRVNSHPTVKPVALMRWLVRMVTPPKGVVLDPFCGSGTTLVAAIEEGFDCIGVEREAEYVAIIEARIAAAQKQTLRVSRPKTKRAPLKVQPMTRASPPPPSAPLPGQLALAWGDT
jgi:DNA modification methylase